MSDRAEPTTFVIVPPAELSAMVKRAVQDALAQDGGKPLLVDRQTLARQLGCSAAHIDNLRKQGLPVVRVGHVKAVRFEPGAVLEWLRKNSPQEESDDEE